MCGFALNKLYKQRLKLNDKAANEIAVSFTKAGKKAVASYTKALENTKIKTVSYDQISGNIGNALFSGVESYKEEMANAVDDLFSDTVVARSYELPYGLNAFKEFVKEYVDETGKLESGNESLAKAAKEITRYGKKLYEESEQYKEDTENLREHTNALNELKIKRTELQNELKKAQKENTVASIKRVQELKQELNENKENITAAKEQIKQDENDIAEHTKEVFYKLRTSLSESVNGFIDPLKVSLDTGIDLFKKFGSETEITTQEILDNMRSQIDGVTNWAENLDALAERGLATGLLDKLKSMGPEGANYVKAFMDMTAEELERANEMFAESANLTSQTLIDNYSDTLETAKSWAEDMQKLATMGFDQKLIEQIGEMGVSGYDYVKAFLQMPPEQIQQFNKQWEEALTVPDSVADKVISSFAKAGKESADGFISAIKEQLSGVGIFENEQLTNLSAEVGDTLEKTLSSSVSYASEKAVSALSGGLLAGRADSKNSAASLGSATLSSMRRYISADSGSTIAKSMCSGLKNGLLSQASSVASVAREMALQAYEAAKTALDSHSPSRKFMQLGEFADDGFAIGMVNREDAMRKSALDVISRTIRDIAKVVDSDVDVQPTIRPVLDLSNIRTKAGQINAMLSRRRAIALSTSISQVERSENQNDAVSYSRGNSFQFVQNNYSPKALSRLEIYRQTKNQFSALKGLM